ncbi:protein of unknown function [Paraburkholderia dioscoreae]|uniref:Uncharacterized protein n=1 Tax=Paraburkholderia dioscoreae TaxID=2604047 RepID=A0A5Q4ZM88_9BURK|nr:protein of unknown function [Paraburkholderia dioscoreae]
MSDRSPFSMLSLLSEVGSRVLTGGKEAPARCAVLGTAVRAITVSQSNCGTLICGDGVG